MYINFWYPICAANELDHETPHRAELLGVRLVAFRDANSVAQVLSDTCIHRGGSLGTGKLVDGTVQCPYHGWRYDATGQCVSIPSMPGGKLPARAKVDAYPTVEKYGVVFAFLGDLPEDERPPEPVVDEDGRKGWSVTGPLVFEVDAYYERSIENGLDPVHNEFVHPSQGAPRVEAETYDIEREAWGGRFEVDFGAYTALEARRKVVDTESTEGLRAGSWHIGPNTLVTGIHLPGNNSFIQYFFEAPIAKNRTRIFFVNARNNNLEPDNNDWINKTFMNVANEDRGIIEELRPVQTPETLTRELLTPGDAAIVCYREYLQDWDRRGWRIDRLEMAREAGEIAYAIPSPARRESGNWVLDPVPLAAT